MAGSRSLIVLLLALLAFVAITAVSADDSGSSITTPVAQSPVENYEGADAPVDSATDDAAETPDAASLGAPVSSTSDSSTDKTPTGTSGAIQMTGIAVAITGALVGYLAL